jgi:peroxiredoxin
MKSRWIMIGGGLLIVAFIIMGSSSSGDSQAAVSQHGVTGEKTPAPSFTLTRFSGEELSFPEDTLGKPVILDFWASWCPNCRRDHKKVQPLYEEFDGAIEIIGINLGETDKKGVKEYVEEAGLTFPMVWDSNGRVARTYGIQYTNVHVLVDAEGNVVETVLGDVDRSHFEQLLEGSIEHTPDLMSS